jgi:Xaa-Pro aminopeptidase
MTKLPLTELDDRLKRFRAGMDVRCPDWELAAIFGRINQFYFTGTIQEGLLFIPRNEEAVFWVRRSYERALEESAFRQIRPMKSFRDAAGSVQPLPRTVYLEMELVPLAFYERFRKHFPFAEVRGADTVLAAVRSIKSPFELSLMEEAGKRHRLVLEERAPEILREGMNEVDFGVELYSVMMAEGHQGLLRFGMFGTESLVGQIGFGENSLCPTCFDGPGGNRGMSAAVPLLGDRSRKLRKGDLVFVDTGFGIDGYHTDKTMIYPFGGSLPKDATTIHEQCVEIQDRVAGMLKPGAIPSEIYRSVMDGLSREFAKNFMGFGKRRVKFIGHGVGLLIDEPPVIAEGFDEPLREGMVLALEPKNGIEGVGMVGIENTFVVTPQGGRSITGTSCGLIPVKAD